MNQSIKEYLAALGSKASTPGGGAAAGLSGAQAAALMAMVCNLTKTNADEIRKICEVADNASLNFQSLINEDISGFKQVMAAYQLPKETREAQLQAAIASAADAPIRMIGQSRALVPHLSQLVTIGNPNLITDVGAAAILLVATIDAAYLNVLINLKSITDDLVKQAIIGRADADAMAGAKVELAEIIKKTTAMAS